MDTFARVALLRVVLDASCAAIAATIVMIAYSFDPPLALFSGALIALFFASVMLIRALFVTEDRVVQSELWQIIEPEQRPIGDDGRRMARAWMERAFLRFAKGGSAIAALLFGFALLTSWA